MTAHRKLTLALLALISFTPPLYAAPLPSEFELSSLLAANCGNGSTGFALNGILDGDISGKGVSAAGDINGDGIGDLIIGAPQANFMTGPTGAVGPAGQAFVVIGRNPASGRFPSDFELSSLLAANCEQVTNVP